MQNGLVDCTLMTFPVCTKSTVSANQSSRYADSYPRYWQARPTWLNHIPVVLEKEGQIVAYFYAAKYHLDEPVLTISEYCISKTTKP